MSCEISFGLVQDISRITTQDQNFTLQLQSYNHSILTSPPIPLSHPTWDHNYSVVGSQKQIIKFYLCSLHPDHYMKVLAWGKFDIRDYTARNGITRRDFEVGLPLDSSYSNQAILHLRCRFLDQGRSRNDGLKEVSFPKGNQLKNRVSTRNPQQVRENFLLKQKYANEDPQTFFKGACETRNFFSFLDPVYKGQTYYFLQPVKK